MGEDEAVCRGQRIGPPNPKRQLTGHGFTVGVHLRALSATPESIVKVYLLYGKTTSSGKVCGFLCSGGQRSEVHPLYKTFPR